MANHETTEMQENTNYDDESGHGSDDENGSSEENKATSARRMILFYQDYLSGLKMGSTCRFDPTCSNYALVAFGQHGWLKGAVLTVRRLARCGPWHPGGWDPVPPRRRR